MITVGGQTIGHISLSKRSNNWHETQVVIGEKKYWSKGYGQEAFQILIKKAKKIDISKIYLEVRPTNTRAIRAYVKCGFRAIKIIKYPKNKYLSETLRMEIDLNKLGEYIVFDAIRDNGGKGIKARDLLKAIKAKKK